MKKILALLLSFTTFTTVFPQNTIKGKIRIRNAAESHSGVTVMAKGTQIGAVTDSTGSFQISVPSLPVTLSISSVGYQTVDVTVVSKEAGFIMIEPAVIPGEEIVISTDRIRKKEIDATVSIVRYGHNDIRNASVTSYNDLALYKKGVDMTTSSMTFKTISTRGFNGSGSTRVNQIVDGMDNQAPGLNFFIGNFK